MRSALFTLLALSMLACSGAPSDVDARSPAPLRVPAEILCAGPDGGGLHCADLHAELFVSGYLQADGGGCPLTVDPDDCTISGVCPSILPHRRRLVLDYFLVLDGGVRLVVGQAHRDVDLRETEEVAFSSGDLVTPAECEHMPGCDNSASSCPTVQPHRLDDGTVVQREVCDLDDDGESNLDEICGGSDPLQ